MKPELDEAINELARNDAVVHATMCNCRNQGLSATDTLAHLVINLATCKKTLESRLMEIAYLSPSRPLSTLAQQVADAQAETDAWPDGKLARVKLAGGDQP